MEWNVRFENGEFVDSVVMDEDAVNVTSLIRKAYEFINLDYTYVEEPFEYDLQDGYIIVHLDDETNLIISPTYMQSWEDYENSI